MSRACDGFMGIFSKRNYLKVEIIQFDREQDIFFIWFFKLLSIYLPCVLHFFSNYTFFVHLFAKIVMLVLNALRWAKPAAQDPI